MRKRSLYILTAALFTAGLLSGCGSTESRNSGSNATKSGVTIEQTGEADPEETEETAETEENAETSEAKAFTVEDQFTERDTDTSYDESRATRLTLSESGITVTGNGATAEGTVATITEKGTYLVSGTLTGGQIIIDTEDKVQLVLANATMSNSETACIYVKNADKVFVTLADGTTNTLSDAGIAFEEA